MKKAHLLTNRIQNYVWGSHTAIAELLGHASPSREPQAEMWMGAHPKAPSMVNRNNEQRSLGDLIQTYPVDILGGHVAKVFGNQLPYLFKVLAAEAPLSIQAHPNADQAASGFARENDLSIPVNAPHRNYRDDRHKPECICALTPFWGLCGFRKTSEIRSILEGVCPQTLGRERRHLEVQPGAAGLKAFFRSIMAMDEEKIRAVVQEAVIQSETQKNEKRLFEWIIKLAAAYPGDIGVIFPAVLNLFYLQPGEAMFLPAGELHAYLNGVGLEIMANSDNVLRGGLTPKHVDVAELTNVLTFREKRIEILHPEACSPHEKVYRTPAEEFALSVITLEKGNVYQGPFERSAEIMLVTEGMAEIVDEGGRESLRMGQGMSVLVPSAAPNYRMTGEGVIYKAAVPLERFQKNVPVR
jgi:mannose-6-phosphate isomerase